MNVLTKQKNYPAIAAALAFLVAFLFLLIAPRGWANTPLAQNIISFVARIVPAMEQLTRELPSSSKYIALTGAAVWGLVPVYMVLVGLMPILDRSFIPMAKLGAKRLNLGNKKVILSYCFLALLVVLLGDGSFFTLWVGPHHAFGGMWLDMLSPTLLTQLATWTTIGLTEYLVVYLISCIGWVLKFKFLGE